MASCTGVSGAARGDSGEASAREARALVDSLRHALRLPGMAVTVLRDGRPVLSEGFGFADVARGTRATADTKFRVGSVSKLFTAVALVRLAESGMVDLNAPVRRYLASYPAHWPDLTLRQLAGHTAGVRHYRGSEFFSTARYASLGNAMRVFIQDTVLFAPGTRYAYSSYGFTVIGATMEEVTGEAFPDLLQRLVFSPLGLRRTVPDSAGRTIEGRAVLYAIGNDGVTEAPEDDLSSKWPGGGYLATTSDLARFGWLVLRPGFLGDPARREMITAQRLLTGATTGVALGWRVGTDSAGRSYLHHGGTSNGGTAFLLVYPDDGLVVAMASNAFARWSTREALQVASIFLRR
jgi:CubicO group peptidase (beta-lactamase class C family)